MFQLRLATCMAENSESFCREIAPFIENRIRIPTRYANGIPRQERERLFDRGEIHILWLCGLPYVEKADRVETGLELLAVPIPRGPRYQGTPVYYSEGTIRSTVVIGPRGDVIKHWPTVKKAEAHPDEVLEYLKANA